MSKRMAKCSRPLVSERHTDADDSSVPNHLIDQRMIFCVCPHLHKVFNSQRRTESHRGLPSREEAYEIRVRYVQQDLSPEPRTKHCARACRGECQENPTHDHHAIRSRRWIDVSFEYALLMSHKIRFRQRDASKEDLETTPAFLIPRQSNTDDSVASFRKEVPCHPTRHKLR